MSDIERFKTKRTKLINDIIDEHTAQGKRIKQLESVLRFYADSSNYEQEPWGYLLASPIENDTGQRARKVLYGDNTDEVAE